MNLSAESYTIIENFAGMLNTIERESEAIREGIISVNKERNDLLHEVEFTKFNACEGYLLAQKMQEVLMRRRELMNDSEAIMPLVEFAKNHKKLVEIPLFKMLSQMRKILEDQGHRQYRPRVRTDLKLCKEAQG